MPTMRASRRTEVPKMRDLIDRALDRMTGEDEALYGTTDIIAQEALGGGWVFIEADKIGFDADTERYAVMGDAWITTDAAITLEDAC